MQKVMDAATPNSNLFASDTKRRKSHSDGVRTTTTSKHNKTTDIVCLEQPVDDSNQSQSSDSLEYSVVDSRDNNGEEFQVCSTEYNGNGEENRKTFEAMKSVSHDIPNDAAIDDKPTDWENVADGTSTTTARGWWDEQDSTSDSDESISCDEASMQVSRCAIRFSRPLVTSETMNDVFHIESDEQTGTLHLCKGKEGLVTINWRGQQHLMNIPVGGDEVIANVQPSLMQSNLQDESSTLNLPQPLTNQHDGTIRKTEPETMIKQPSSLVKQEEIASLYKEQETKFASEFQEEYTENNDQRSTIYLNEETKEFVNIQDYSMERNDTFSHTKCESKKLDYVRRLRRGDIVYLGKRNQLTRTRAKVLKVHNTGQVDIRMKHAIVRRRVDPSEVHRKQHLNMSERNQVYKAMQPTDRNSRTHTNVAMRFCAKCDGKQKCSGTNETSLNTQRWCKRHQKYQDNKAKGANVTRKNKSDRDRGYCSSSDSGHGYTSSDSGHGYTSSDSGHGYTSSDSDHGYTSSDRGHRYIGSGRKYMSSNSGHGDSSMESDSSSTLTTTSRRMRYQRKHKEPIRSITSNSKRVNQFARRKRDDPDRRRGKFISSSSSCADDSDSTLCSFSRNRREKYQSFEKRNNDTGETNKSTRYANTRNSGKYHQSSDDDEFNALNSRTSGRIRYNSKPGSIANQVFDVGERIEAKFKNGSRWYPGKIVGVRGSTYSINYDDGDFEKSVPAPRIRSASHQRGIGSSQNHQEYPLSPQDQRGRECKPQNEFTKGQKVEARYRKGKKYYPGCVSRVNKDGTYAIAYQDGDMEGSVEGYMIRADDGIKNFKVHRVVDGKTNNSTGIARKYTKTKAEGSKSTSSNVRKLDLQRLKFLFEKENRVTVLNVSSLLRKVLGKPVSEEVQHKIKSFARHEGISTIDNISFAVVCKLYDSVFHMLRNSSNVQGDRTRQLPNSRELENIAARVPTVDSISINSKATSNQFAVGDYIEARYGSNPKGSWCPGTIMRAHPNGTFDVAYDDGDSEQGVRAEFIRLLCSPRD